MLYYEHQPRQSAPFRFLHKDTAIYGITGYPLEATDSPVIHNEGYRKHGMNAVYIPIRSDSIEETLRFADELDIKGLSVTVPHKESVIDHLSQISNVVYEVGACNTIRKEKDGWHGFNTDSYGIKEAIKDFLGVENQKSCHYRRRRSCPCRCPCRKTTKGKSLYL